MRRLIVMMSPDGVIASNGELPFRLADDLKFFKELTTGRTIVMGRKTYESIGKALPNRHNVVITRNANSMLACYTDATFISSHMLGAFDDYDIIGGAEIYRWALEQDLVDEMIVTIADGQVTEGVLTKFPMDMLGNFEIFNRVVLKQHDYPDERNEVPFTIYKFERNPR